MGARLSWDGFSQLLDLFIASMLLLFHASRLPCCMLYALMYPPSGFLRHVWIFLQFVTVTSAAHSST